METTEQVIVGVELVKKEKKKLDGIHWGEVWGQYWKAHFPRLCTEVIR